MDFEAYLDFLTKLGDQFARMTAAEQEMLRAVQSGDLAVLNDCIRQEQANGLALRGMEQQRETMQARLGLAGGSLRQLPQQCPEALRPRAQQVVNRVLEQYQVLGSARDAVRTLLECQLHRVETKLTARGLIQEDEGTAKPPRRSLTDIRA